MKRTHFLTIACLPILATSAHAVLWTDGMTNTISGFTTFGVHEISGGTNTVTGTGTGGAGQLTIGTATTAGPFRFFGANNTPTLNLNSDNTTAGRVRFRAVSTIDLVFDGTGTSTGLIASTGTGTNPGQFDLNGSSRTFNIGDATGSPVDMTISAKIVDTVASGGITKTGAGTIVLSGTNTYAGATSVTGGTLLVNGDQSGATGATTVGTGASLGGSGTIGGTVTIQGGGTLAAGTSINSLATGELSLVAASIFAYEMNNDALPGEAGDLTAVTGNLILDLANTAVLTLEEEGAGSWAAAEKLTLISYTGTWNNGQFQYLGSPLADDSTFTFSGISWQINYNDTAEGTNYAAESNGTFVTLTAAVPEPNVAALMASFGVLALLRRLR